MTIEEPTFSDITDLNVACKDTNDAYVEMIDTLKTDLTEATDLSSRMAESLVEIDPNTENSEEATAFIRKMYKLRGETAEDTTPIMPYTPETCVGYVAGKVIQIENLQEDVDNAVSFRDFFADVYCAAYVKSLVTMTDGLSQVFPGGLDGAIEEELQRAFGPFEADQLDTIEINAIEAYLKAVEDGSYVIDESILIKDVEPLKEAMALCESTIDREVASAKQDREDYLNDYNFLAYLRTV